MLTEAEVAQLDVPVLPNDEVVRLQITMNVVQVVHAFDGQDGLSDVELRHLFAEYVFLHQEGHEISALQVLHHQVQVDVVLKRAFELNDPRILRKGEDVTLCPNMSHLILIDHLLLLHLLDSHNLIALPVSANPDLSKGSSANDFPWSIVPNRNLCPLQPVVLRLLVQYLLLDQLLLLVGQPHLVHLARELVPGLFSLSFLVLCLGVLVLDVCLGACGLLPRAAASLLYLSALGAGTGACVSLCRGPIVRVGRRLLGRLVPCLRRVIFPAKQID